MKQYEYRILTHAEMLNRINEDVSPSFNLFKMKEQAAAYRGAREQYLNELGADGWELVGIHSQPGGQDDLYFKREKAQEQ